ncbi:helix-turn-helix transcriptional regulator [Arsenophonus nasoniae]|nr:helix-turn-helix transcriptional regulator [Arsenophonus nasoniae]WGM04598.1 helix-turn-helix transcriptional regulator [Arsenophonus nasoniae]WGM09710.1 helix-turn-helix transcriptional regulator [Arsenophonus nasoniae]WGM14429.1 helix-turn-helix transcriptional regulator [Arsenophonus nasoniae]
MLISEKLKAIRKAERLSQAELCKIIGISISTLKKLEGNHNEPGWTTLQIITKHPRFEKYTLWLMTDKVAPESGQIEPAFSLDGLNISKKKGQKKSSHPEANGC